ncbi:amino acid/polyamine transporter I, partial [Clohesyomyces aquaticus]
LASPTRQPYLHIFYTVTKSKGGATVMGSLVIVMFLFCKVTTTATSSRQIYAFARDKGLHFHRRFSQVSPKWDAPFNSLLFSFCFSCALSLINLGSPIASNIIGSLGSGAGMASYAVSIGCVALRRIHGQPLLPSKFKLGRWGLTINIISLLFLALLFVWSFFPPVPTPTPDLMNWAALMFGVSVLGSWRYYYLHGKHQYDGPVA